MPQLTQDGEIAIIPKQGMLSPEKMMKWRRKHFGNEASDEVHVNTQNALLYTQWLINKEIKERTYEMVGEWRRHGRLKSNRLVAALSGTRTEDDLQRAICRAIVEQWESSLKWPLPRTSAEELLEHTRQVILGEIDPQSKEPIWGIIDQQFILYKNYLGIAGYICRSLEKRGMLAMNRLTGLLTGLPTRGDIQRLVESVGMKYARHQPETALPDYGNLHQHIIAHNLTYDIIVACQENRWRHSYRTGIFTIDPTVREEVMQARLTDGILAKLPFTTADTRIGAFLTRQPRTKEMVIQIKEAFAQVRPSLKAGFAQLDYEAQPVLIGCVIKTLDAFKKDKKAKTQNLAKKIKDDLLALPEFQPYLRRQQPPVIEEAEEVEPIERQPKQQEAQSAQPTIGYPSSPRKPRQTFVEREFHSVAHSTLHR